MKLNFNEIIFYILFTTLIVGLLSLVLTLIAPTLLLPDTDLTWDKCCGGNYCSDTYYSKEDNLCHLSLCEASLLIFNKSECRYKSK